jgi:hypothetical protein
MRMYMGGIISADPMPSSREKPMIITPNTGAIDVRKAPAP